MSKTDVPDLVLFESKQIRRYYDSEKEIWYFSVIDIVQALTNSVNATDYLKKLRKRDHLLGLYLGTNCPQVDMLNREGKKKKNSGWKCRAYSSSCSINSITKSRAI